MGDLYILGGETGTGKTTELMKWCAGRNNIAGIFQPVIEGIRFFYDIESRVLKRVETDSAANVVTIGKYRFDKAAFEWAQSILLNAHNNNFDWLIIDEIGPLELEGKGLEPAITKIMEQRKISKSKIVCVVRDKILDEFLNHYTIKNDYRLFDFSVE